VTSFLVESYTPAAASTAQIEASARRAASGTSVRYVRSIFVPDDEICFHLLQATSADSVEAVIRAAGIDHQRIMEVTD
jgi:hypothetical protein